MILVIPFPGPSDYLDELQARLLKLGGLGGHRLIVPAPKDHLSGAEEFVTKLRSQFVSADIVPINTAGASSVRLFRDGVMAAAKVRPTMQEIPSHPVCWVEPGYVPTQPDWADKLQSAFFNSGGGVRVLAEWRKRPDTTVGNGNSRHVVQGGWEPEGPAVFPAGFINACELIHRINDGSDPWRERLQFVLTGLRAESPTLSDSKESLLVPLCSLSAGTKKTTVAVDPAAPEPSVPPDSGAVPVRRTAARTPAPAEA